MSEKKKLPYFSDVVLFKRVDKYLDDNIDKQMIDKEAMVDELRNTYKEYHRRNKTAFRLSVFKAYNMINQNILEVTQDKSNEGSDVETIEDCSITEGDRSVAEATSSPGMGYLQGLNSMTSSVIVRPSKSSNNELINISSDEEDDEPPTKRLAVLPPLYTGKVQEVKIGRPHTSQHHLLQPPFNHSLYDKGLRNIDLPSSCGPGREGERRKKPKVRSPAVSIFKPEKKKMLVLPDYVPEVNFSDFGGYSKVIQAVGDIVLHFCQSDIYDFLGVTPPRGLILHGPPGCGKTLLAHAIAGELNLPLVKVSGPELIGGISGESEGRIRKLFQQAKQQVPCILFIDEIDVISQTRENARKDMERRIVSQLISCLDGLRGSEEEDEVLVIGATNRVEELDPGLRRAGRFDKEVSIGIPDRTSREEILGVLCRNLRLSHDVSIKKIAELTPGYVAADLKSLLSDSAVSAVKRISAVKKDLGKSQFAHSAVPTIVNSIPIKITDDNASDSGSVIDDQDSQTPDPKEPMETNEVTQSEDGISKSADGNSPDEESNDKNDKKADSSVDIDGNSASNGKSVDDDMEVVENGVVKSDDEQKSEDLEACIIIDDSKCNQAKSSNSINGSNHTRDGPDICIEMSDILKALKSCQPSAKREGFATVPDVTWDDIGSLKDVRNELKLSIMLPVKYPEEFARMGINAPSGILLWGPPGCGKTLLAKAVANEANINFISVKGPELLNMYVGESEKAVRTCFARARNSQPCVIFFDEIDALCPRRSSSSEGSVSSRVVNQVLTEMDGVEGRQGVFLMAATNRPDMVDPAVLRPGRLDKIVRVNLPNAKDREDILKAITKNGTKPPLEKNLSLEKIANCANCSGFSGADLAGLVKEASVIALTEYLNKREEGSQSTDIDTSELCVREKHFDAALEKIKPSVLGEEKRRYEMMEKSFSGDNQC